MLVRISSSKLPRERKRRKKKKRPSKKEKGELSSREISLPSVQRKMANPKNSPDISSPIVFTHASNNTSTIISNLHAVMGGGGSGGALPRYSFVSTSDDIRQIIMEFFAACGATFKGASGGGGEGASRYGPQLF